MARALVHVLSGIVAAGLSVEAAEPGPWTSLNPGGGGQIQAIVPDPIVQGRFYEVSDMEGINESRDYGQTWSFVRGHVTGEMFAAAFCPKPADAEGKRTVLAAGIYAAQVSYDDGQTWSFVPGTANNTVGIAEFDTDGQNALLGPGWHIKDVHYVWDPSAPVRLRFNGTRGVWLSGDEGKTWSWSEYEAVHGYRQVYTANEVVGSTGSWVLGAHSGVYVGGAGGWTKLPLPPGAVDGTPDVTERVGGCRGAAVTPDGSWVYAAWATQPASWEGPKPPACNDTVVSTVFAARLPDGLAAAAARGDGAMADKLAAGIEWHDVGASLSAIGTCIAWGFPAADPTAPATEHRLLLGWGATGSGRDGLVGGSMQPPASGGAQPTGTFARIASTIVDGFNSTEGWEYRTWRPFAYAWKPKAWAAPDPGAASPAHVWPEVYASGDMNLMRSNWSDPGFPTGPHAWAADMYNRLVPTSALGTGAAPSWPGEFETWATNGFQSTFNFDGTLDGQYAIQGQADHGILESWDGGLSWTQFSAPPIVVWPSGCSKSTSMLITPPVRIEARNGSRVTVPVVLAHAGVGYGAAGNKGNLIAKALVERTASDRWEAMAGGGTVFDKACKEGKLAGLPNANYPSMAIDPHDPRRLFVGTEMCGLWMTRSWPALLNATLPGSSDVAVDATFVQVTPTTKGDPLEGAYVGDVAVDAVRPDVLFVQNMRGKAGSDTLGLFRGVGSADGSIRFSRCLNASAVRMGSLAAWPATTAGATARSNLSATLFAADEAVHLSLDSGETFAVALTSADVVRMRGSDLPWYDPARNVASFSSAAGIGDVLVVASADNNFQKGFGVFRGVLCDAGGRVEWEDWTGQGTGSAGIGEGGFYRSPMYASMGNRARIVGPPGAEVYVLSSRLTGMWSRPIADGLEALRARCG